VKFYNNNTLIQGIYSFLISFISLSATISCSREIAPENSETAAETVIYATVELARQTKIEYSENDPVGRASGLKSVWEEGDFFYAFSGDKTVRFEIESGVGTSSAIFSASASGITEDTQWKAVIGKNSIVSAGSIACPFTSQTASLSRLGDFDYIVAEGSGTTPGFDFSEGTRLSYFIRIVLPAGIRYIEYCTSSSWTVSATENTVSYDNNYDKVSMVDLGVESAKGDVCYLSIPAVAHHAASNVQKGCIFTFFNSAKTKSNGTVVSLDLSGQGGKIGTLDFSEKKLIDRPLASEAISFGAIPVVVEKDQEGINSYDNLKEYKLSTSVSPAWAPFNLGANITNPSNREALYGEYYCWGEINPRTSFSDDNSHYSYHGGNTIGGIENYKSTWIGPRISYPVSDGTSAGTMTFQRISGTKYDAARVKWGSEWRMPTPEELMSFTGGSLSSSDAGTTTETGFTSTNIVFGAGTYYEQDVPGRKYTKNGKSVFFPHGGRYGTGLAYNGVRGFYWSDSRIRTTPSNGDLTNNPLGRETSGGSLNYSSFPTFYGLTIRPVLNIEGTSSSPGLIEADEVVFHGTTISSESNIYGIIQDEKGKGIPGVTVSDGYSCVSTDENGVYQMKADSRIRTVNVTVPASYEIPIENSGKPSFYQYVTLGGTPVERSFKLAAKSSSDKRFTIIVATDEHVNTDKVPESLTRFKTAMEDIQETVTDLRDGLPVGAAGEEAGEVIAISIGDQLWDNMTNNTDAVLSEYRNLTDTGSHKVPFFFTIGNHDHDNSTDNEYSGTASFVRNFGPTQYSFDRGNAHIIVMDDILMTGSGTKTVDYKAGFTTEQVDWLKADVAKVSDKSSKIVILCVHAPLSSASAGDSGTQSAVMSQLKNNFKSVHVFSGHTHVMNNNYYKGWTAKGGRNISEHTIQSLAGYFWKADISFDGGSPAGYGVYTFESDDLYAEYNKVTKEEAGFQFRVYNGNDTYNPVSYIDNLLHGGSRGYTEFNWDNSVKGGYVVRLWDASSTNDSEDVWTFKLGGSDGLTRVSTAIQDAAAASYIYNTTGLGDTYGDAKKTTDQIWYGGSWNSTFNITATHTLPSGWSATYTLSNKYVTTSYNGFPYGVSF